MNYKVLPGKESVFERAYEGVLAALNKGKGHTRSTLYQEHGKTGSYLILSEWENEADFQAFVRSEAFAKVTNWGKEQVLAERPSHRTYRA